MIGDLHCHTTLSDGSLGNRRGHFTSQKNES